MDSIDIHEEKAFDSIDSISELAANSTFLSWRQIQNDVSPIFFSHEMEWRCSQLMFHWMQVTQFLEVENSMELQHF